MIKSFNFSPSSIDQLKSGSLRDPLVAGLCVIATGNGKKIWQFRRRIPKLGTTIVLKFGAYPGHSIAMARQWAAQLNETVDRGVDPREERRIEAARAMTLADAHSIYMTAMQRGDRKTLKPRTILDKEAIFKCDIGPRLGKAVLADLTENQCWDAVYDKAKTSKVRANKMAGELSCFLRWCAGREGRMDGILLSAHPAPTLNSNWFATGPKANKRFLSEEELGWFLQALAEEEYGYRRGFILLLLTAARRNELFGAPASEIADGVWTLPAERSKNGEPNIVALGPWGRHLAATNHKWLFPSPRLDGPQLYGWFKARDRVHRRMEALAEQDIPRWHFHDLRRTFRSHSKRLGIDREIAELMLNHKRKGLEGIYNQNEELDLRRSGFAAWEAFLVGLVPASKLNVLKSP